MRHRLLHTGSVQMILHVIFLSVFGKVLEFHLFIGITAAVIDLIIGVLWGSIAGLAGGRVDNIMMRIADVLTAVPYLLVVIILTSCYGAWFSSNDYCPIDYRLGKHGTYRSW